MATNPTIPLQDRILEAKIKLYYDLHLPDKLPAPLLIALHGYGANKHHMLREAREMVPEGFAIASLQGFYQHLKEPREEGEPLRFGFGWLTNFRSDESVALHHNALLDLSSQLIKENIADSQRLFLLGFSQSCALNYRFAFSHPAHLRGVIGMCGGLPGDWEKSELYQPTTASVLHLAGARDEFYPPSRVETYPERLRMRASNVEFYTYDAAHEIVPPMREDIKNWLKAQAHQVAEKSKTQIWG
jgi:phospholipase/carboxylesterase